MNTLNNQATQAVVLDQSGHAWGLTMTSLKSGSEVDVYNCETIDGTPVNTRSRKIMRGKKYFKELRAQSGYETFVENQHNSNTYYKY